MNGILNLFVFVVLAQALSANACKDARSDCTKFKSFGWCDTKARAMTKYCAKTCNLCQTRLKYIVVTKPTRRTPVTQSNDVSQCFDNRNDCISLDKRYGWCTKRKAAMKKLCQKTCGFCAAVKSFTVVWKATTISPNSVMNNGQCKDKLGQCPILKKRGFCERNEKAMRERCSKSCGFCGNSNVDNQSNKIAYQASQCKNTWPHARCAYYSHLGWCDKHGEIQEKCRKTCVCDRAQTKPKQKPDCSRNKYSPACKTVCRDDPRFQVLCSRFGNDCDGNGGLAKSLKRYCPKTCQLCT